MTGRSSHRDHRVGASGETGGRAIRQQRDDGALLTLQRFPSSTWSRYQSGCIQQIFNSYFEFITGYINSSSPLITVFACFAADHLIYAAQAKEQLR